MTTFLNDLITKTLKNRPVAKVLSLCIMAAYAATVFDVTKLEAFSLEWCLALAKGTAIKSIYICAPVAVFGGLAASIIEDASIKTAETEWLSDLLFDIFRHAHVLLGIAAWLILVSVPALVISECVVIATGGMFNINALWVSVMGTVFPETLIGGLLWLSRAFVILYYLYCLIAPVKVKEEPVVGKGIVGSMNPPKKISKDEEDAA